MEPNVTALIPQIEAAIQRTRGRRSLPMKCEALHLSSRAKWLRNRLGPQDDAGKRKARYRLIARAAVSEGLDSAVARAKLRALDASIVQTVTPTDVPQRR